MNKLSNDYVIQYLKRLIPKLFKLMPLKENKDINYHLYLEKLIIQVHGFREMVVFSPLVLDIICNLEGIRKVDNIKHHNSIVKECIKACEKSIMDIKEGDV